MDQRSVSLACSWSYHDAPRAPRVPRRASVSPPAGLLYPVACWRCGGKRAGERAGEPMAGAGASYPAPTTFAVPKASDLRCMRAFLSVSCSLSWL